MATTSNRGLARQLGVSETAVRRAEKAGRIRREVDLHRSHEPSASRRIRPAFSARRTAVSLTPS